MKEARGMEHYMMQDKERMEDFAERSNAHDAQDRSNRHKDEGSGNKGDASRGGITREGIHQEPDKQPPVNNGTHSEHPNEQNIHDDANSTKSDLDPIEEHNAIVMRQVVLNASFDLSEVEQPNDPADLFEEIRVFRQLYEDLEIGRKERNIERARQVDEAYFANLSQTGKTPRTQTEPPAKASRIQLYRSKVWSKVRSSMQTIKRRLFCR
ncbi:hypothetical protein Moror_3894 [Moniliophthora roreri MCA 2997]|uniref:Uncharacterized protein n=1 Tax=Moniliophthora roreri (strain MCA 2997) TaxID=1381753 RepID=V2YUL6_MONRO|nr:hypothetical protein Moror_3894 [Moniliophthora roreri MCA 2997]